MLAGRRYIVCRNQQEAQKDAADRASIVAALERQLAKGDKALVGNTGFRRYLKTISDEHFAIDPDKIEEERKFDGIFVLRTNTDLNPLEAMLCYKQLWTVEQTFRTAKHLFSTRPIFHKLDETIRGHVFCSFLALVLKTALEDRIAALGSLRLLAGNHRRSGLADRDRDRARRQALHRPLRAAPGRQPGLACRRHRAAADRPRGRRLLTSPNRKRSATAPSRRRLLLSISYLVNRTVEDGFDIYVDLLTDQESLHEAVDHGLVRHDKSLGRASRDPSILPCVRQPVRNSFRHKVFDTLLAPLPHAVLAHILGQADKEHLFAQE